MKAIELVEWIVGLFFGVLFLSYSSVGFINTLSFLLLAIILIPPTSKFVFEAFKIKINKFLLALILVIIALATTTSSGNKTKKEPGIINSPTPTSVVLETPTPTPTTQPTPTLKIVKKVLPTAKIENKSAPTQVKQIDSQNIAPVSSEAISQKNAVRSAKSYLSYTAFSHDGLVAQLEYEKFSHADAVYGADNSGANWNEQAAKSAKQYMEYSAFSRGSLIDQLKYSKFTQEQAEYGANAVGL